uniref:Protein FAR1-RELATED SEQUENCE n=1 Tax=Arundo donax TaxID=35708 RepID=A0A0A9AXQ5_ARUDO
MSGKKPKTILTDQCAAIINAVEKVFPDSIHRLCIWHVSKCCYTFESYFPRFQNISKRLCKVCFLL